MNIEKNINIFVLVISIIRKIILISFNDIVMKKIRSIFIFIMAVIALWQFGVNASLGWLLVSSFFLYGWSNRVLGLISMSFLISCPILLFFHKEVWADLMIDYAYFILIIVLFIQIVELKIGKGYQLRLMDYLSKNI